MDPNRFIWHAAHDLRYNINNTDCGSRTLFFFYLYFTIETKSFTLDAILSVYRAHGYHASSISYSLRDSLRYPCAQYNCATVDLYALCCNNWYRNNSLPFLLLCRNSKKIRTRVLIAIESMTICKRVLYCKKRFSCCTIVWQRATRLPTAALHCSIVAKRQYFW